MCVFYYPQGPRMWQKLSQHIPVNGGSSPLSIPPVWKPRHVDRLTPWENVLSGSFLLLPCIKYLSRTFRNAEQSLCIQGSMMVNKNEKKISQSNGLILVCFLQCELTSGEPMVSRICHPFLYCLGLAPSERWTEFPKGHTIHTVIRALITEAVQFSFFFSN